MRTAHVVSAGRSSRELAELAAAVQTPLTTGRRVAVVSARGGAGKSTVAALLGSLFALRRAEPVLAVDADPGAGSLAWLLGLGPVPTLDAMAAHLLVPGRPPVTEMLARTRAGLWVLGGGAAHPETPRDVTRALSRFFALAVVDCGAGLPTPATAAVLGEAHAIVLVTAATPDGLRSTAAALDTAGPDVLRRVVVALTHPTRRAAPGPAPAGRGVPVVALPFDRQLARAEVLDLHRVGEDLLVATSRLAAAVLARAGPLR